MENKEKELIKNFESLSKFIEENDIPALILIKTNEDHFSATISNIDDITELFAKQSHNDDDLGHALSYIATLTMGSQCSMNHRKFFEFQRMYWLLLRNMMKPLTAYSMKMKKK